VGFCPIIFPDPILNMAVCMSVKNTFFHIEERVSIRKSVTIGTLSSLDLDDFCFNRDARLSFGSVSTTPSIAESTQDSNEEVIVEENLAPRGKGRLGRFARKNAAEEGMTTIMIRNIPGKYTQEALMEEVWQVSPLFNFFHMPVARKTNGCLGYAFVNFIDAETASKFIAEFQGHAFIKQLSSPKRADVTYAALQGFAQNMKFYQRSKIFKSRFRPYVNRNLSA
jgi:RNA recognition motif-containing protein